MQVTTKYGIVEGLEGKYEEYRGIPYAKAKRFEAPVRYKWEGVLETKEFGDPCYSTQSDGSEDCLYLNIFKPKGKTNLPVAIRIHGGAFQNLNGNVNCEGYLENDQYILVTFNYRLGVFGYLYTGGMTGNLGTLDQMSAIEWVFENIEYFGGDKDHITLMGESAGAKSVAAVLGTTARKYISQAIFMSGGFQCIRSINTAKKVTEDILELLKIDHVEELYILPASTLVEAQRKLCVGKPTTCTFGPVQDGMIIPDQYMELMKNMNMPIMLGSSLHELGSHKADQSNYEELAYGLFGTNGSLAIQQAKQLETKLGYEGAWIKVLSDNMYRTYTYRYANMIKNNGSSVYLYTTEYLDALHCVDVAIAFSTIKDIQIMMPSLNTKGHFKENIRRCFINFILYGNPGFASYHATNQQMVFDEKCYMREVKQDEALQDFPDDVYRR